MLKKDRIVIVSESSEKPGFEIVYDIEMKNNNTPRFPSLSFSEFCESQYTVTKSLIENYLPYTYISQRFKIYQEYAGLIKYYLIKTIHWSA